MIFVRIPITKFDFKLFELIIDRRNKWHRNDDYRSVLFGLFKRLEGEIVDKSIDKSRLAHAALADQENIQVGI